MNYLTEISNDGFMKIRNQNVTVCTYVCKCGVIIKVRKTLVVHDRVKSCGCLKTETLSKMMTERNKTHGLSKHPLYKKWKDMKARCLNVKNKEYKNYGGRGIEVSDKWVHNFQSFYDWAISKYETGLTLERIDVNGNYNPLNCKFATLSQQARNRRPCYNKTGYPGVYKIGNKFSCNISLNNEKVYLGLHFTAKEAYSKRIKFIEENETGHKQ